MAHTIDEVWQLVTDLIATVGVAGAGLTAADDAVMTRLGTPADTDIATDIANVQAASDAALGSSRTVGISSGDRQGALESAGHQSLLALTGVTTLTVPTDTRAAYIIASVAAKDLRFTLDGTTPSSTVGTLLPALTAIFLDSPALVASFKAIEVTSGAKIDVEYFK